MPRKLDGCDERKLPTHPSDDVYKSFRSCNYLSVSPKVKSAVPDDIDNDLKLFAEHILRDTRNLTSNTKLKDFVTVKAKIVTSDGQLPLHSVCSSPFFQSNPDIAFRVFWKLFDMYPQAMSQKNLKGNLPLHLLLENATLHVPLITSILDAFPKTAEVKNSEGSFPLFIACRHKNVQTEIIRSLLQAYPAAASTLSFGCYALHQLVFHTNPPVDALRAVVDAFPTAASLPNTYGNLPLHLLCSRRQPTLEAIRLLIHVYPGGISHRNKAGDTPIDKVLGKSKAMNSTDVSTMDGSTLRLLLRTTSTSSLTVDASALLRELNWAERRVAVLLSSVCQENPKNRILPHLHLACNGLWKEIITFL